MVLYCREFVMFMNEYLEEVLPLERRAAFEAHLAVCPPCVKYLKSYEQTIRMGKAVFRKLDEEVPDSVPEDLVQAILKSR